MTFQTLFPFQKLFESVSFLSIVCETRHKEFEVEEDVPQCTIVKEERCKPDEHGEEWCNIVPRRVSKLVMIRFWSISGLCMITIEIQGKIQGN